MKIKNEQGVAVLVVFLIVIIVGILGGVGWYVFNNNKRGSTSADTTYKIFDKPSNIEEGEDFKITLNGVDYYTITGFVSIFDASSYTLEQDAEVKSDISAISVDLENYYEENDHYPTLTDMSSSEWRKQNLKNIKEESYIDPSGKSINTDGGNYWYSILNKECDNVGCQFYELSAQTSKTLYGKKATNSPF